MALIPFAKQTFPEKVCFIYSKVHVNSVIISCKNTTYSTGKTTRRKVEKTCKKWLTDGRNKWYYI